MTSDDSKEVVAWLHKQGNYSEASNRQLDDEERSRGWTQTPLVPQRLLLEARAQIAELLPQVSRLQAQIAALKEQMLKESRAHVEFVLIDHPKALAERDARIAQLEAELANLRR